MDMSKYLSPKEVEQLKHQMISGTVKMFFVGMVAGILIGIFI